LVLSIRGFYHDIKWTYEDQGHVDTDLENEETLGTDSVWQAEIVSDSRRGRMAHLHLDSVGNEMR